MGLPDVLGALGVWATEMKVAATAAEMPIHRDRIVGFMMISGAPSSRPVFWIKPRIAILDQVRLCGILKVSRGDIAQLGERCNRTAEVVSSNLIISTTYFSVVHLNPNCRTEPHFPQPK